MAKHVINDFMMDLEDDQFVAMRDATFWMLKRFALFVLL
jgi:hypothetical protein